MTELRLELPWAPSINRYWTRLRNNSVVVSEVGKQFIRRLAPTVRHQFRAAPIENAVAALVEYWEPIVADEDLPKAALERLYWWDLDNRCKPLLDGLTASGLWVDDCLVRDVRLVDRTERDGAVPGGRVVLWVRPLIGG